MFEFPWKSAVSRIKKDVVMQYYERGGVEMIDIGNFIATMKSSCVKKYSNALPKEESYNCRYCYPASWNLIGLDQYYMQRHHASY